MNKSCFPFRGLADRNGGGQSRIHSYYTRLLALCLLVMLLLFSLQTGLFYRYSNEQFLAYTSEVAQKVAVAVQHELDLYFSSLDVCLDRIYQYPKFLAELNNGSQTRFEQPSLNVLARTDYYQHVIGIYVYNNANGLRSYKDRSASPIPVDPYREDNENARRLQAFVQDDSLRFGVLLCQRDSGDAYIRVVKRLYQNMGNTICGYLVCDLHASPLISIVRDAPCSQDQYIWIASADGHALYLSETQDAQAIAFMNSPEAHIAPMSAQLRQTEISSGTGLSVCIYTGETWMQHNVRHLLFTLLRIAGVTVLLFAIYGVISARRVNRRMRSLIRTIDAIGDGETGRRFENCRRDEIGTLCSGFNDTLDRLAQFSEEEAKSRKALEDARFQALQAQVNPHFLYNTLDNIGAIAEAQGCEIVGDMCGALSKMFRYSIRREIDAKSVTLREEMQQVDDYMFIINVRMRGEVLLDKRIDEATLDAELPRLSIQPLVENAISHGLRNKRGEKRLWIESRVEGDAVIVTITDNGTDPDVEAMNQIIRGERVNDNDRHSSIGMRNIHERVRILFGAEYGLTATRVDDCTCVRLCLPRKGAYHA